MVMSKRPPKIYLTMYIACIPVPYVFRFYIVAKLLLAKVVNGCYVKVVLVYGCNLILFIYGL